MPEPSKDLEFHGTAQVRTVIARRHHRELANQIVENFIDRGHSRREFSIEYDDVNGGWAVYTLTDPAREVALKALADYTGSAKPEGPWWNFDMGKALDLMLPAIREAIAGDIESQLTWNAVEGNKLAPLTNEMVRRAAEIARTGSWSQPRA